MVIFIVVVSFSYCASYHLHSNQIRTALMNCSYPLRKSVMMDYVPKVFSFFVFVSNFSSLIVIFLFGADDATPSLFLALDFTRSENCRSEPPRLLEWTRFCHSIRVERKCFVRISLHCFRYIPLTDWRLCCLLVIWKTWRIFSGSQTCHLVSFGVDRRLNRTPVRFALTFICVEKN